MNDTLNAARALMRDDDHQPLTDVRTTQCRNERDALQTELDSLGKQRDENAVRAAAAEANARTAEHDLAPFRDERDKLIDDVARETQRARTLNQEKATVDAPASRLHSSARGFL